LLYRGELGGAARRFWSRGWNHRRRFLKGVVPFVESHFTEKLRNLLSGSFVDDLGERFAANTSRSPPKGEEGNEGIVFLELEVDRKGLLPVRRAARRSYKARTRARSLSGHLAKP
jgi:hypothetical protein